MGRVWKKHWNDEGAGGCTESHCELHIQRVEAMSRMVAQVQPPKWHPSQAGRQSWLVPTPSSPAHHFLYPGYANQMHIFIKRIPLRQVLKCKGPHGNLNADWALPIPLYPTTRDLIQYLSSGTQKVFKALQKSEKHWSSQYRGWHWMKLNDICFLQRLYRFLPLKILLTASSHGPSIVKN